MASSKNRPHRARGSAAGARPRILRIGILLGDTFIEERLVRERKPVTIGQSARNVFSLPIEGMPRSWPLFDLVDGNYVLKLNKRMDGRVAVDGKPRTIESLRGREARPTDDYWTLPLTDRSRGKIELGEMKLLFQFVAAPSLQPRPRLPASVRGTLADRIDPRLAMIMTISLIVHFAVALWAFQHDQVKERYAQKRLDEFRRDRYEIRTIELTQQPSTTDAAETADKAENEGEPDKPKTAASSRPKANETGAGGDEGPPDDATLEQMVNNVAALSVLGAGEDSQTGRYGKASDVDQGVGLDKAQQDLKNSGATVVGFGAGDRRSRGPASGGLAGEKGDGRIEGVRGGGSTETRKEEEKIASRASFTGIDEESDGTLDPNKVARKIQSRYRRGLQQCHERLLKVNPRAGGRVQLSFTVGPTGRVTKANVKGFDPTVDACIKGQAAQWRFSAPKEDGKPTSADFEVPLLLKPGA